jgi:hypothetical protein
MTGQELRNAAGRIKDGRVVRRMLAIAGIFMRMMAAVTAPQPGIEHRMSGAQPGSCLTRVVIFATVSLN